MDKNIGQKYLSNLQKFLKSIFLKDNFFCIYGKNDPLFIIIIQTEFFFLDFYIIIKFYIFLICYQIFIFIKRSKSYFLFQNKIIIVNNNFRTFNSIQVLVCFNILQCLSRKTKMFLFSFFKNLLSNIAMTSKRSTGKSIYIDENHVDIVILVLRVVLHSQVTEYATY